MADQKLSELDSANTVGSADLLYLVKAGVSKKATVSSLASSIALIIDAVTFDSSGTIILKSSGTLKLPGTNTPANLVGSQFAQLQWTTDAGLSEADPNYTGERTNWMYVDATGIHLEVNVNNSSSTARGFHVYNDGTLMLPTADVPEYTTSAGVQGTWAYDSNAVYVCVAENTWKRALLTDW